MSRRRRPQAMARDSRMAKRLAVGLAMIPTIVACVTSSQTLTGSPRAPLPATEVRVYTQAPPHFEEIAVLSAASKSVSSAGGERAIEKMIETMKAEAARLGANGLLLEDFSDSNGLSLGTGAGTETDTHNASINLNIGVLLGVVRKEAQARAIFVAPERRNN